MEQHNDNPNCSDDTSGSSSDKSPQNIFIGNLAIESFANFIPLGVGWVSFEWGHKFIGTFCLFVFVEFGIWIVLSHSLKNEAKRKYMKPTFAIASIVVTVGFLVIIFKSRADMPTAGATASQSVSGSGNAVLSGSVSQTVTAGPGSIITQGQTGGNNSVTNNFTPPDRELSPDQEKLMVEALSAAKGSSAEIDFGTNDSEVRNFAEQLVRLIDAAGIHLTVDKVVILDIRPNPPENVQLYIKDRDKPPAMALILNKQLLDMGFHVEGVLDSGLAADAVKIVVGPRNNKIP